MRLASATRRLVRRQPRARAACTIVGSGRAGTVDARHRVAASQSVDDRVRCGCEPLLRDSRSGSADEPSGSGPRVGDQATNASQIADEVTAEAGNIEPAAHERIALRLALATSLRQLRVELVDLVGSGAFGSNRCLEGLLRVVVRLAGSLDCCELLREHLRVRRLRELRVRAR